MPYVEEREFNFRLEVRCPFPDDYDGELDGYAWVPDFQALTADLLRALLVAARARPGWTIHFANRGRSSEDEVTLVLERQLPVSATE